MKIIHSVASVDDETAGPSYSVPSLAAALKRSGHDTEVVALGKGERRIVLGATIATCPRDEIWPRVMMRLGRSGAMRTYLRESRADVFHAHGLWMMANVYPAEAAQRRNKPFVLAPRGMLGKDALKFSSSAKKLFWAVWQKRAAEAASCFHATAESEYEDIRRFGLKAPVAIVPNGIDLPKLSELGDSFISRSVSNKAPFILSLGRIHPKKGLDRLIAGFAQVAPAYPEWQLKIVGPDELGHASELSRQAAAMGVEHQVQISPPILGQEKFLLMRQAEFFVLPTLHENFGMTVAESLAVETPVISTIGAPWSGLNEHRCGWWVDHGPEALATVIRQALEMPRSELQAMGIRGRDWMRRDFAWEAIGDKMLSVYSWLLGLTDQPDFVQS